MKRVNADTNLDIKRKTNESKNLGSTTKSFVIDRKKPRLPAIPEYVPNSYR